ncbi:hypothetical protein HRED_10162 [Candidatus Haloredivivus sp. G17]|nr:hypothetical protein HRED_10162 [Candidatus Haloredivivus sp. G17]
MHAEEIAQIVIEALDQEEKNFIMLNFANCDTGRSYRRLRSHDYCG